MNETKQARHVDAFVDDILLSSPQQRYARWWLLHARLSAVLKSQFAEFMNGAKLFCAYEGARYRVTGASRFGDVWLTSDHNQSIGYTARVDVDACSDWGRES